MTDINTNPDNQDINPKDADKADEYADIIDMPHHTSKQHPRMTMAERAAQFSSFAALKEPPGGSRQE